MTRPARIVLIQSQWVTWSGLDRAMKSLIGRLSAVDWRDWRVRWILGTPAVAVVASLLIYMFVPSATDATRFAGALFASWVSGLILTVVVTLVITIVTLARPDQEIFEARARNLLRRQTGPHIDYIIPQLQKLLQPYCDEAIREMEVTDYDEDLKLFRVNQYSENRLKSYLNDMPVTFESRLAYVNGTAAPENKEKCSLTYLKVDGSPIGGPEHFDDAIERTFEMRVLPHATCKIEHRMVYWLKAETEPNRHRPTRYTKQLKVVIRNQLPSRRIAVFHPAENGKEEVRIFIEAGQTETVVNLAEIPPGENVYDFRLVAD